MHRSSFLRYFAAGLGLLLLAAGAWAQQAGDPSTRAARLALVEGTVSFQPGGTNDWVAPPINRPLTTGDHLWSDRDGRAELQLDGSTLRLASNTSVGILNIGDHVTQIQLSGGSLLVHVRRLDDDETYEVDTPNLAFSVLRPGLYRLTVDESGNTSIKVRSGQGEATGAGSAYAVHADEDDIFSGANSLQESLRSLGADDDFDAWSAGRDAAWDHSASARYVSPDVVGYTDLDSQGIWNSTPDYGYVWFPRGVDTGWAPYHEGHWAYVAPWGYTWIDDQPWGFAPFHYGRWVWSGGAWGWIPAPPRPQGSFSERPVYAPALVAWVGVGAGIAWFALGPREVYVPSYPVSRDYINQINVSNTTVNNTVINNVYNTTIINNKTVNVTKINNVTYVNRNVPGAVTATTPQAFTGALPVGRNRVALDSHVLAGAQVRAAAPAEVPSKQAVLGSGPAASRRPPESIQNRIVVARVAPPAPPAAFEQSQAAIRNNAGKPLSAAQSRQIKPATAPPATVRLAPAAAKLVVPAANVAAPVRPTVPVEKSNPPAAPAPAVAIHPRDLPAPPKPPSPAVADSVLERQHRQEQQQLQAQQAAERRRVQQQQDLQHQQQAKQQAQAAQQQAQAEQRRQMEQQHQQQTEQLAKKHAEQQQQLAQRQQEQTHQQATQPRPVGKESRPPTRP